MKRGELKALRAVLRGIGLTLLAAGLFTLLHVAFWHGGGRHEFNSHYGIPDRMLGFGELRLYVLTLVLGIPAGGCFVAALRSFGWVGAFRFGAFWHSRKGLLIPALLAGLGAFFIAHFVTHHAWFTDDEQAYLLQAKLYAQGRLTAPVLEPRAVLAHSFVVEVLPKGGVPQWTGVYPVLQPFMMALSGFLGSYSLSQYACVALITYHTGRFAQGWFRQSEAGPFAAWLCALSPQLLGLGATYHTSILGTLLSLIALRLLLWVLRRGGILRGIPLGLVAGSIVLTRPLEGALVISLVLLCLVGVTVRSLPRQRVPKPDEPRVLKRLLAMLGFGIGGLLPLFVFVTVNLELTGHPLQGAYTVLERTIGRFIGFGTDMMWGRTHTPELGVVQTVSSLVRVNAFAFGWPASLALVLLALMRPFRSRKVLILLAISAVHVTAYFFLAFGAVHDFGHVYHVWHLPFFASISAWVLVRVRDCLPSDLIPPGLGRWVHSAVAAMAVCAVVVFWPAQLTRWRDVSELIWEPVRAVRKVAKDERAIALWTRVQPPGTQRSWVFRPPAPLPDAQILWAYDSPPWYSTLKKRFPDRIFVKVTWHKGKIRARRVKL